MIRQHVLWLDDIGADFLLVDWSNNIWGKQHWSEHPPGVDELIHSTTALMDTLAQMRREGIPTPQVTLLLGLVNGPPAAMSALNEEMRWVAENYVGNPRYAGLWVTYQDKPLIVVLNTLGPDFLKGQPPVDTSAFTVRWMADQGQAKHFNRAGFWSWMDGASPPLPTFSDGQAEALTVTPAFFGDGGWLGPQARAREGGATYLDEFGAAFSPAPPLPAPQPVERISGSAEGAGVRPEP